MNSVICSTLESSFRSGVLMKDPAKTFPPTAGGIERLQGRSAPLCSRGKPFASGSANTSYMRAAGVRSEFVFTAQENMRFAYMSRLHSRVCMLVNVMFTVEQLKATGSV